MINQITNHFKKGCKYLRNITLWLTPFFIFCIFIYIAVYSLKGNLSAYTELLKILIWPVTVLIGLFFFRKVVTYMFFSMNEFNFFGVKGKLKNVDDLINEEVDRRFKMEKEEMATKEEMKRLGDKLNDTSATAAEERKLAREIYKLYQSYKEDSEKRIQDLILENSAFKENQKSENLTPAINKNVVPDMGTGEKLNEAIGVEQKI